MVKVLDRILGRQEESNPNADAWAVETPKLSRHEQARQDVDDLSLSDDEKKSPITMIPQRELRRLDNAGRQLTADSILGEGRIEVPRDGLDLFSHLDGLGVDEVPAGELIDAVFDSQDTGKAQREVRRYLERSDKAGQLALSAAFVPRNPFLAKIKGKRIQRSVARTEAGARRARARLEAMAQAGREERANRPDEDDFDF
jgi:hypothetical protein